MVTTLVSLSCLAAVGAQDLAAWNRVLHAHVHPGNKDGIALHVVDYAAIKADPDFAQFLASLDAVRPESLGEAQWKALFLNAYNAFAVKMVTDHACKLSPQQQCLGPISFVGEVAGGVPGAVFKLPAGRVGGQVYTLEQIEDMLRRPRAPFTADPRIHACITCASVSCPDLRAEAYSPEMLEPQMEQQMKVFLTNTQKGLRLDRQARILTLSTVFNWMSSDFVQAAGSTPAFVARYLDNEADRNFVAAEGGQLSLAYFPWDRSLNGYAPCTCGGSAAPLRLASAKPSPPTPWLRGGVLPFYG